MQKLIFSILFLALIPSNTIAQIIPDSSLGAESSVVNSEGNRDTINGGAIRNANLFHSFQEFNVGAGREAYFTNPNQVKNIFSRVTGNSISDIQGVLGVLGNANLFLINPNGILFGKNARLDVNGSFFATSADSVVFGNGFEFSAANPNQPPLLTIDIPIGLRFRDNSGDIIVRGKGNGVRLFDSELIDTQEALRVDSNATIGLLGGNLVFEDATIKTPGGRIELGSITKGEVNLVEVANGFTFDYSGIETFADISLSGTTIIDASGLGAGDIQVAGKNISITGISGFISETLGATFGRDINILATDSLVISGVENDNNFVSAISNRVFPNATADGGDINIKTGSLSLEDRAVLTTSTLGQGNAGKININASESVSLASEGNTSAIISSVAEGAIGDSGDINLTTPFLTVSNGAFLNAITSGQGKGGNITINATDNVIFTNNSAIFVTGTEGGSIDITANNLSLLSGSIFSAGIDANSRTTDQKSGDIEINLTEDFLLDGLDRGITGISNRNNGIGNVGNIIINARNITLNNSGVIFNINDGEGSAGNINLNATGDILFDGIGSRILNLVSSEAIGDTGEINITAQNFILTNGAAINNSINGNGNSGDINLDILDNIRVDGFGEFTSEDGKKNILSSRITSNKNIFFNNKSSGNININTKNLNLSRNGTINTNILGQGNSGNININADSITIGEQGNINLSPSSISSNILGSLLEENSQLEFKGGDIIINTNSLLIKDGGNIDSGIGISGVMANGGDISITASDKISLDGSGILKSPRTAENILLSSSIAAEVLVNSIGSSGKINIFTPDLSITNGATINTSNAGIGNAGDIGVTAHNINIDGETPVFISILNEEISLETTLSSSINSNILNSSVLSPDERFSEGNAGKININTNTLSVINGAEITTDNAGIGNAGEIKITARNINIDGTGKNFTELVLDDGTILRSINKSQISSSINSSLDFFSGGIVAKGNSGDIEIKTGSLAISNDAIIDTNNNGMGNAGNIKIDTTDLSIINEAIISTSNSGEGNAGNIFISANDNFFASGGFVTSNIGNRQGVPAVGKVGSIVIEARQVLLSDTAQIQAGFFSGASGNSGIVFVKAKDSISFTGERTGIFSNTEDEALGNGTDIELSAPSIFLSDGAILVADNAGEGNGGNINVYADNLQINRGTISSTTASDTGGEIKLKISDDLTLRNNSQITARADNDATGGNIDIEARYIIAYPSQPNGNDIIASAERGKGGEIQIQAEAIFGIQEKKATSGNRTNDIDASSEFGSSGIVEIQQPDVNPASGLVELTQEVVNASELIAQNVCNQTINSEFVNIGKGGLPPNPDEILTQESVEVGLVEPVTGEVSAQGLRPLNLRPTRKPPAQGWIWHEDGTVELVAYNPNQEGEPRTWDNPGGCKL